MDALGRYRRFSLSRTSSGKLPGKPVQLPGLTRTGAVLLPNGWSIDPAGKQLNVGDFPVNSALTADGKYAAVLHAGYGEHQVRILSLNPLQTVSTVRVDQTFFGMTFLDNDRSLIVSGAEDECLYRWDFAEGYLNHPRTIRIAKPKDRWVVSGITSFGESSNAKVIACGMLGNELAIIDAKSEEVESRISLPPESFAYGVVTDRAGKRAYVSLWGQAKIALVDLEQKKVTSTWEVASHPTELVLIDDDKRLLVACSDDNSIQLLDTESGKRLEVIRTSLYPKAPNGSTSASLCVSPDSKVLIAANADNNNLALFDISERGAARSLGFIPTVGIRPPYA